SRISRVRAIRRRATARTASGSIRITTWSSSGGGTAAATARTISTSGSSPRFGRNVRVWRQPDPRFPLPREARPVVPMSRPNIATADQQEIPVRLTRAGWRIVVLASLGGTLEFYDFVVFGVFARDI